MNFKKLLLIALATGMLPVNAFAETAIKIEDKTITVTCDAQPGGRTALTVARKNHQLSETQWIVAVKECVEENGKAVFRFNMPDMINDESIDGEYVVYTKAEGEDMKDVEFIYVSPANLSELRTLFKSVESADELKNIFEDTGNELPLEFMGYNIDEYKKLDGVYKTNTCLDMFNAIEDFSEASEAQKLTAFTQALILNCVNSSSTSEDFSDVISDMVFENVTYKNISDENLKSWIGKCLSDSKTFRSYDELLSEYEISNIMYKINTARFSSLKNIIETYAEDLDITSSDIYKKYTKKSSTGDVNEKLAKRIEKKKPQTADELLSEIRNVLESDSGKGTSSGGGNYNPGGSNGGSGGGMTVLPQNPNQNPKQDEKINLFNDVDDSFWGYTAISILAEKGVVNGDDNGNFRPNDNITREEFVKMVVSIKGDMDSNAECNFDDVQKSSWYYKYVANAVNKGIVFGKSENLFGSGEVLTRQDMTVICHRITSSDIEKKRSDVLFNDEGMISDYAKIAIHELYQAELINGVGDNIFEPLAYATRAQAAQILYSIFY